MIVCCSKPCLTMVLKVISSKWTWNREEKIKYRRMKMFKWLFWFFLDTKYKEKICLTHKMKRFERFPIFSIVSRVSLYFFYHHHRHHRSSHPLCSSYQIPWSHLLTCFACLELPTARTLSTQKLIAFHFSCFLYIYLYIIQNVIHYITWL